MWAAAASVGVHLSVLVVTSRLEVRAERRAEHPLELTVIRRAPPAPRPPDPVIEPVRPPPERRRAPPRPAPSPAPVAPEIVPEEEAAPPAPPPAPVPLETVHGEVAVAPAPAGNGAPRNSPDGVPGGKPGAPGLFLAAGSAARLALKENLVPQPPPPTVVQSLERTEWKHRTFFDQVRRYIRQRWRPEVVLRQRARANTLQAAVSGRTIVEITIDDAGSVRDTRVVQRGGAEWLDDEAVRAARAAGPFVNPPRGLFGANGRFTFRFGFQVAVVVPTALARLLKPNDNVLQAVTQALSSESPDSLWCFRMQDPCARECPESEAATLHAQIEPCHFR